MSIQIKDFGKTTAGQPVKVGILANDTIEVHILSYGATIQQLLVPDRKGNKVDVVLGYPTVQVSGRAVTQTAGISGTKVLNFPDLLALESQGYTRYYDGAAKAAYWVGGENFVSGEDEQSIRDKAQWAVQQGLQGAAVWSYGQDDSGKLLAWLKEALSQ